MGWNEARVQVVADRWQFVVEEADVSTSSGENVRLISMERVLDSTADPIPAGRFEHWLLEFGFALQERWPSGANYLHDDVLVEVYCETNEASNVSVQFTLSRDSPARWQMWRGFIEALCEQWPFALGDPEAGMKVGPERLFELLRRTVAWQEFESRFSWPSPPERSQ